MRSFRQPLFSFPYPLVYFRNRCNLHSNQARGGGAGGGRDGPGPPLLPLCTVSSSPTACGQWEPRPSAQARVGTPGCGTAPPVVGPAPGLRVLAQGKFPCLRSWQEALREGTIVVPLPAVRTGLHVLITPAHLLSRLLFPEPLVS